MISKNKHTGLWEVTCDSCTVEFCEVEADSFSEAVAKIRGDGWNIFQDDDGEWLHTCIDCGLPL